MNEFPSPALTRRFLVLCEQYGSEHLAVQIVAVGRSTGVRVAVDVDAASFRAFEHRQG